MKIDQNILLRDKFLDIILSMIIKGKFICMLLSYPKVV